MCVYLYMCIYIIYTYVYMCVCFIQKYKRGSYYMSYLKAVVTEFHRLSALNNKPFISHSFRGIEVQDLVAGRFSSR